MIFSSQHFARTSTVLGARIVYSKLRPRCAAGGDSKDRRCSFKTAATAVPCGKAEPETRKAGVRERTKAENVPLGNNHVVFIQYCKILCCCRTIQRIPTVPLAATFWRFGLQRLCVHWFPVGGVGQFPVGHLFLKTWNSGTADVLNSYTLP